MKKIKIKICGIRNLTTLDCCNQLEVNYFGLVFYKKSPRNIEYEQAIKLIDYQKNRYSIPVGVFVDYDINNLSELIKKTNLKYIQLHGSENNEYMSRLKDQHNVKIIKMIGIQNKNDINLVNLYSESDFLLFDHKAKRNELPGGNAVSFDWSILRGINFEKPWFISGGINRDNIKDILENLNPYGIDISSGVEGVPGNKSSKKINEIVKIIDDK